MEKIHEEIKKALELRILMRVLRIIGIIIIIVLIFEAGIMVGFHKASFGRDWGEHYNENFGMGHETDDMGFVNKFGAADYFPNANGAVGKILKIELPSIIVQDEGGTEKAILIGSDTKIQKGGNTIPTTDLKIDDFAVVIGTPNAQGVIEAKFIRVIPNPELLK